MELYRHRVEPMQHRVELPEELEEQREQHQVELEQHRAELRRPRRSFRISWKELARTAPSRWVIDVSRAHFQAKAETDIYVENA